MGGFYTAGHDLFLTTKDPAETRNYYRWDWKLYEKQAWCKTCYQGVYAIYGDITTQLMENPPPAGNYYLYTSGNTKLLEDCYYELTPPPYSLRNPVPEYTYDYTCRTQCWEIIYSHDFNLFSDQYTNGGVILNRKVAQIPFYDHNPGLVEIRQCSVTPDAYRYFTLFQQQTQNTGGLADTPPSALVGNVHNVANGREAVVGYFTASTVSTFRYWLDRKDVYGTSLGSSDPKVIQVCRAESYSTRSICGNQSLSLRSPILRSYHCLMHPHGHPSPFVPPAIAKRPSSLKAGGIKKTVSNAALRLTPDATDESPIGKW